MCHPQKTVVEPTRVFGQTYERDSNFPFRDTSIVFPRQVGGCVRVFSVLNQLTHTLVY